MVPAYEALLIAKRFREVTAEIDAAHDQLASS
jgi:hypothetical protein